MSQSMIKRDLDVVWHPCTQMKDHHDNHIPLLPIKSGHGVYLEDYSGKQYIDAISSWWVNLFGHTNPYINQALSEQAASLEHVILAGFSHEPVIRLSERLVDIAPPGLTHCFYADNGSSAVEVALKMSFHYWQNKKLKKKKSFITLNNSYHGETLGALSVSNMELYKQIYAPLLMEVFIAPSPDCYQRQKQDTWEQHSRKIFTEIEILMERHQDQVCAVIVEPLVQCAGGMRMYHPIYLKLLRDACDHYNIHLIADEIAVGFGRTGTMFACEQADITPDFMCLSKGLTAGYLPLSTVMTTDEVYAGFYTDYTNRNSFLHSHSYTGNPLACAVANASLDLFAKYDTLKNNQKLAKIMQEASEGLKEHAHVAEVRQCGMILAIEIVQDKKNRTSYPWQERRGLRIYQYALDKGVIMRPLGNIVYAMPPYIINKEQLYYIFEVVAEAIEYATTD